MTTITRIYQMIKKYLRMIVMGGLLAYSMYLLCWNAMNFLFWHVRLDDNWGLIMGVFGTPIFSALMANEARIFYKRLER